MGNEIFGTEDFDFDTANDFDDFNTAEDYDKDFDDFGTAEDYDFEDDDEEQPFTDNLLKLLGLGMLEKERQAVGNVYILTDEGRQRLIQYAGMVKDFVRKNRDFMTKHGDSGKATVKEDPIYNRVSFTVRCCVFDEDIMCLLNEASVFTIDANTDGVLELSASINGVYQLVGKIK